jgi:hypothetical protein
MELTGIISISGKAGLAKIVSQTRTGLIVESLIDGKRLPIYGAERVSSLEDISIYTYEEDLLLSEVFKKMFDHSEGKEILSHKSSEAELRAYLEGVLPNYDQERVYVSDIRKLVQWFNLLLKKGLLTPPVEEKKPSSKTKKTTAKKDAVEKTPLATDKKKKTTSDKKKSDSEKA